MADLDFGLSDLLGGLDGLGASGDVASALADVGTGAGAGWSDFANTLGSIGSSFKGFASGVGDFAKGALPFAQLGTAGLGLATGIRAADQLGAQGDVARQGQKIQQQAAGTALGIAEPLKNFGSQQLERAAAGKIPDAARSTIDSWKQGKKAELRDYFARAGLGDSQSIVMAEAQIDKMADELVLAEIERENQLGLSAFGGATSAAGAAAGAAGSSGASAGNQELALEQLIANANAMLARIPGGASK